MLTELSPAGLSAAMIDVVEQAALTVSNAAGRAEPLCFIRSWDGEARLYANLVRHLPTEQPVYTVQRAIPCARSRHQPLSGCLRHDRHTLICALLEAAPTP